MTAKSVHPNSLFFIFFILGSTLFLQNCSPDPPIDNRPSIQLATHFLTVPDGVDSLLKEEFNFINDTHHYFEDDTQASLPEEQNQKLLSIIEKWENNTNVPLIFKARAYRLGGYHLANLLDYPPSTVFYQQAIDSLLLISNPEQHKGYYYELAYCYNLIGTNYDLSLKLIDAQVYHRLSLEINLKHRLYIEAMKDYTNMSTLYQSQGDIIRAEMLIDSGFQLGTLYYDKFTNRNDTIAFVMGLVYKKAVIIGRKSQLAFHTLDIESAEKHMNEFIDLYENAAINTIVQDSTINPLIPWYWYFTISNFSKLFVSKPAFLDTSLVYANKLIDLPLHPPLKIPGLAVKADVLAKKGQCEAAFDVISKIEYIFQDYPNFINQNPQFKLIEISNDLITSRIYENCAISLNDPAYFNQALIRIKRGLNNYEQFLLEDGTDITLSANNLDYFYFTNQAIATTLDLYHQTNNDKYLKDAFILVDHSKSLLVKRELSRKKALANWTGKQKQLLEQDTSLSGIIARLNIEEAQGVDVTLAKKQAVENRRLFINRLKNSDDPNLRSYYLEQFNTNDIDINEARNQLLTKNKGLLAFRKLRDEYVVFSLTQDSLKLFTIALDKDFHEIIKCLNGSLNKQEDEVKEEAFKLYQKLLREPLNWLKDQHISSVIVIQDKYMNDITFDYIPTAISNQSWNHLPLLIDSFEFSYDYSISNLIDRKKLSALRSHSSKSDVIVWGGLTNTPKKGRGSLKMLYEVGNEVLENYTNLTVFSKESAHLNSASREQIFKFLPQLDIAQLIMHGKLVDDQSGLFYLALDQQNGILSNRLYPVDIYGMNLKLEILILLNCQAATEYKPNTFFGRKSMARAFTYAGCRTILAAYDDLPDAPTAEIIRSFYKYLLIEKKNAVESLKSAKQDYRHKHPGHHPHNWANLVIIGDGDTTF